MAKNRMKEVAAIFNKKLGEEFSILLDTTILHCAFTKNGIKIKEGGYNWMSTKDFILRELFTGDIEIIED